MIVAPNVRSVNMPYQHNASRKKAKKIGPIKFDSMESAGVFRLTLERGKRFKYINVYAEKSPKGLIQYVVTADNGELDDLYILPKADPKQDWSPGRKE